MKHILILLFAALLLLVLFSGCGKDFASVSSSSSPSSAPFKASSSSSELLTAETQSVPEEGHRPEQQTMRHISAGQLDVRQVDTSAIEKINESVRADQNFPDELPGFLAYEDGCVLTSMLQSGYTVTRYFLDERDPGESISFEMQIMDPDCLTLSGSKMVFPPCTYDPASGFYVTKITLLDFETGQATEVFTDTVAVYDVELAKYGNADFAFFYIDALSMQHVMLYDETGGCSAIYETPYPKEAEDGEKIYAICCEEENIYLLMKRTIEEEAHLHCVCFDHNGQLLSDRQLDVLDSYTKPNYCPDQITVCGKYIFIKFYSCGRLPYFTALRLDGDTVQALDIPEPYPCWKLTSGPVHERYLVFNVFPDHMNYTKDEFSSDLAIFDLETEQWTTVKLLDHNAGEVGVVCSADGELLFCDLSTRPREKWFTANIEECISAR